MKIFGSKKKKKVVGDIKRLVRGLEENPEDTESRVKLAGLYVETGDRESAIQQYQIAAEQLSAHEFDLESIAVYKRILTLDGGSLSKRSLAAFEKAEELLGKARKAYEKAFQTKTREDVSREALEAPRQKKGESPAEVESPERIDFEAVATEMAHTESLDDETSRVLPGEASVGHPPDLMSPLSADTESGGTAEPDREGRQGDPYRSREQEPDEGDAQDVFQQSDVTAEYNSLPPLGEQQIDMNAIQMDDVLETIMSDDEIAPSTDDPLTGDTPQSPGEKDIRTMASGAQGGDPHEKSAHPDQTEPVMESLDQDDPDLHYNLGIAYYEMDLIDKAIKEFVKAHNQGIRMVDSLFMLAKCYFKKGHFQHSAGFVYQALKLDNLTQDQIDMLQGQLEEIKARIEMASPSDVNGAGSQEDPFGNIP